MTVSDIPANYVSAALNAGCAVISASTPAISGTYPIDIIAMQKMMATAIYIAINDRFPAQQTSWVLRDMSGVPHAFPTTESFMELVTAVADYVALLVMIIDGIGAATLPPQPTNIP